LNALNSAHLQALSTIQVANLTTDQVAALTTSQLNLMETADIRALTTAQIGALTTDQVVGLSTAQMTVFSATQVKGFRTDEIAAFTTDQIVALSTQQIAYMSDTQVAAFSSDQQAAMTSLQISALNNAATPLILDLNGDGVHTVGVNAGVHFDLTASGQAATVGWASVQDGFLAMDKNHDGKIGDGSELFGSAFLKADGSKASDGFDALASLDSNHDGHINALDAQFKDLTVWQDSNQDGTTQSGELHSLSDLGITDLSLGAHKNGTLEHNNWIGLESTFTTADGQSHALADVWLAMNQNHTLDLTKLDLTQVQAGSMAQLDISGNARYGGDTVILSGADVERLGKVDLVVNEQTGTHHVQMMIRGDSNDNVQLADAQQWHDGGTTVIDGETFRILNDEQNHQLLVGIHIPTTQS
jgi:hypothetical protein